MTEETGITGLNDYENPNGNGSWASLKARLFTEDADAISWLNIPRQFLHHRRWSEIQYWHTSAGTEPDSQSGTYLCVQYEPVLGIWDLFKPGIVLATIGYDGGLAAIDMAREFRETSVLAVDQAFGAFGSVPSDWPQNLFLNTDIHNLPDNTIDAFISDMGVAVYDNTDEMAHAITRVAKLGAVFRGTKYTESNGNTDFDRRLASLGWDVWNLCLPPNIEPKVFVARLSYK